MLNAGGINRYVAFKCHGFIERGKHFSEWAVQLYLHFCPGKTLERPRSFVLQVRDVIFIRFSMVWKYRYAAWMIHLLRCFGGFRSEWRLRAPGGDPPVAWVVHRLPRKWHVRCFHWTIFYLWLSWCYLDCLGSTPKSMLPRYAYPKPVWSLIS